MNVSIPVPPRKRGAFPRETVSKGNINKIYSRAHAGYDGVVNAEIPGGSGSARRELKEGLK